MAASTHRDANERKRERNNRGISKMVSVWRLSFALSSSVSVSGPLTCYSLRGRNEVSSSLTARPKDIIIPTQWPVMFFKTAWTIFIFSPSSFPSQCLSRALLTDWWKRLAWNNLKITKAQCWKDKVTVSPAFFLLKEHP